MFTVLCGSHKGNLILEFISRNVLFRFRTGQVILIVLYFVQTTSGIPCFVLDSTFKEGYWQSGVYVEESEQDVEVLKIIWLSLSIEGNKISSLEKRRFANMLVNRYQNVCHVEEELDWFWLAMWGLIIRGNGKKLQGEHFSSICDRTSK